MTELIQQVQLDEALGHVKSMTNEVYLAFHQYASENIQKKEFKQEFSAQTGQAILLENDFVDEATLTQKEIANVDNVIAFTWLCFVETDIYKALKNTGDRLSTNFGD